MFNRGGLIVFPLLIVAVFILSSCATSPPRQELADAEAAVSAASHAGAPKCASAEFAAAQHALDKGRALAGEFCHELEARRMLIDAKIKADEAKYRCLGIPAPPPTYSMMGDDYLKDIFFDFASAAIRPDAEAVLEENADVLRDNSKYSVVIEGYADIQGGAAYNMSLAKRRANTVRDALVKMGVKASRIDVAVKGETSKFARGKSIASYKLNRRVHFIPVKPGMMHDASVGVRIHLQLQ